jgi:ribosome-associated translation inhibitor RaiA
VVGVKLILSHGNVRPSLALDRLIENRLLALGERQRIEEAVVRLADEREASPRFRASILVRVPGPDIHAAACDHTVGVAVRKMLAALEAQVAARQGRRLARQRPDLPVSRAGRTVRAR